MTVLSNSDQGRDTGNTSASSVPLLMSWLGLPSHLMYPSMLAAMHGPWAEAVYNPSYAMASDADAYEVCMRNEVFRQSVNKRIWATASRNWFVRPVNESTLARRQARIMQELVGHIEALDDARALLGVSVIRGMALGYIRTERRRCMIAGIVDDWRVPVGIEDIDIRRARWGLRPDGGLRLELYTIRELAHGQQWSPVPDDAPIIRCVYGNEEARLGCGNGLLEAAFHRVFEIETHAQLGTEAAAFFARGVITAAIDGLRASAIDNEEVAQQWLTALENMRRSGKLVHDALDKFEIHTGGEAGMATTLETRRHLEDNLRALILGSSLPFGGQAGREGSFGRAKTEADVHEDTIKPDNERLNRDLTRDLLGALIRFNWPILQRRGLAATCMGHFDTHPATREDPKEFTERAVQVRQAFPEFRFSEDQLRRGMGFLRPESGEAAIGGSDDVLSDEDGFLTLEWRPPLGQKMEKFAPVNVAAPVGTRHQRKSGMYEKTANNKWNRVSGKKSEGGGGEDAAGGEGEESPVPPHVQAVVRAAPRPSGGGGGGGGKGGEWRPRRNPMVEGWIDEQGGVPEGSTLYRAVMLEDQPLDQLLHAKPLVMEGLGLWTHQQRVVEREAQRLDSPTHTVVVLMLEGGMEFGADVSGVAAPERRDVLTSDLTVKITRWAAHPHGYFVAAAQEVGNGRGERTGSQSAGATGGSASET